ncbi:MAG TPA: hypothetical protein VJK03_02210 [Candidatus Nanoarchaeia archaeon]|nr:hypothetical protein [Candidatus Nanoarchaeia archaeon]
MGLMRKRNSSVDILDLTLLQKKGLLNIPERKPELIDLVGPSASTMPSTAPSDNPFGMLDSFAQNASAPPLASAGSDVPSDMNALKIKLDDFEFKFQRLIERLEKIESSLDNLK